MCIYFFSNIFVWAQTDLGGVAMSFYAGPFISYICGDICLNVFFLYFQLKPVSTTTVLVAARGLAHSIATDAVLPLLVTQRSSSSLGSGCNKDVEEKVLAGSVEQITPLSTERSSKKSRDTEYIMNLLKVGNEQTKQTLKKIDSTLSAYTPDVKRS